jgi:hypothetical protein
VNIFLCVVHHDREHILVCCVHYDREHVLVCCVHHDRDIFWCVVFIMSVNIFWCVVFIMTVNIFWCLVFIMTVNIFWCVVFIMTVNWGIEIKSLFLNVSFRFILHTFGFFSLLLPHSLHIVFLLSWVTRRVPHVEHVLSNLSGELSYVYAYVYVCLLFFFTTRLSFLINLSYLFLSLGI